jgi:hypothetical protein
MAALMHSVFCILWERRSGTCVARVGDMNEYIILVGKPERKKLLRRPRYISGDNVKLDFKRHCVCVCVWTTHLTQDGVHWRAFVNTAMDLRSP